MKKSTTSHQTSSGKRAAENIKEATEGSLTVLWDHLPAWQQDNHYIHSGYRPASGSYWKSYTSLSYLHNESVNIWSHLVGAWSFAIAGFAIYSGLLLGPRYKTASQQDVLVVSCFFLGAIICMGMSATYHTISNHSEHVGKFGNKLDYLGIVFLIVGSFIPCIYYGFACRPDLIRTYLTMITTIGLGCAITSMSPTFASPAWRPFRAGMFVAMGLSAVVPVLHGLKLYGPAQLTLLMGLPWVVLQGSLYVAGAAIYALRVPERFKPGCYDIWGSSHQIFHFLVVLAAVSHLTGLVKAFDYHHNSGPLLCTKVWLAT